MMNGLLALPQWRSYFGQPSATILGTMNAMYPVGKMIGLLLVTFLSDRFGRRFPLRIGLPLLLFAAALQGSAQNVGWFIASRFLVGFGTSFIAQPSPILITELAYPLYRGRITGVYYSSNYLGTLIAAWVTYGTFRMNSNWSWRIPSILQATIPLIQLVGIWWIPESPRWLIAKGKHEQARKILEKHHAGGDQTSALVDFEMREIEASIRLEAQTLSETSYLDLIRTLPNLRRTFISMVVGVYAYWAGVGVITYYLTLVLNTIGITAVSTQTLLNALIAVMNFFTAVGSGLLVDRAGRRFLFMLSVSGMLIAFTTWTILSARFSLSQDKGLGKAVLGFIFIFSFFFQIAFSPLLIAYPIEIWPFTLRARGLTVSLFSTYSGLLIGLFVTPIGLRNIGWKYYIVFCVLLALLWLIVYFVFPETRGRTLEEINNVFETPVQDHDLELKHVPTVQQLDRVESKTT
ncbi:hypothetical protein A1O3_04439 [Capronia epimyces CBS 606.96]|uniref:Major facilitator superfamily (MFS) profile domain-containing protein n=1 Tax=Capronia epimyces CBS 606.96 TaxID=1182542 RepID=W9YYV8_9EURO|nr:uncharacterized protein A1O3_04439 [Capronia epimyces CBS 606.96]EXJ87479.1 hypothetical protein A1O3_04439 [Capronia epimyces CBS 606.96]